MPRAASLITFSNVRVVSDGLVLIVEHRGQRFGVPESAIEPGSTVRMPGDCGVLVIREDRARNLGLVE